MATATREKYAGSELMSAIVLLAIVAGLGALSGWLDLQRREEAKSTAITEAMVGQVAEAYLQTPFDLSLHLRQYQAVRDSESLTESPDQLRIFTLGSERTAMQINRVAQIYEAARTSPEGAEPFIRKNISIQEARLSKSIAVQGANIPAGRPQHRTMMADLLELELWYRVLSAIQTNQPVSPVPTDLNAISNASN